MAKVKASARERVTKTIIAVLTLAETYRNGDAPFSFDAYPELDAEVNRMLIALSDGMLEEAEKRARNVLDLLELGEDEESVIREEEDRENGLLWAIDLHSSNLKRLLEAWIAIMFARSLSPTQTLTQMLVYMDAPEASALWRDAVRKRVVDPNEVRFGKGYQRRIADAFTVLLQTFVYTVFVAGTLLKGRREGAIGYRTYRQSGYDCPLCDSLTERIWPLDTMVIPAHPRCVCGIELVYG